MGQSIANFSDALKIFYEGPIREQLNNEVAFLKKVEHKKKGWNGSKHQSSVHLTRNWGIGSRADGGTLPTAGNQGYVASIVNAKYNYGRIEVTGPVIAASANDKGSFVRAVRSEIEGMVNDLKVDMNRQLMGKGDAVLCLASELHTAGDTVINVDSPGTRYLKKGMKIQNDYTGSAAAVSTVNDKTQFTLTAALSANIANNAKIIMYGAGTTTECNGIMGLIDDSTHQAICQSISRSAYPDWKSTVITGDSEGATQTLTESMLYQAFDAGNEKGNAKTDMIMGHHSARRALMEVLDGQIQYVPQEIKAGVTTLTFNGIPIFLDKDAPYNYLGGGTYLANSGMLYFIDSSTLKWYVQKDFHWSDLDGNVMKHVADKDAYEAIFCVYANLGILKPNANSLLAGFTVSGLLY